MLMDCLAKFLVTLWERLSLRAPKSNWLFVPWVLAVLISAFLMTPIILLALLERKLFPSREEHLRRKTIAAKRWLGEYRTDDRDLYFRECFVHVNNGDAPHTMGFRMQYDEWKACRERKQLAEAVARAVEGYIQTR